MVEHSEELEVLDSESDEAECLALGPEGEVGVDEEERQLDGLDQLEQFERYDLQLLVVHNFVHYEVVRLFYRPFRVQSLFGIVHLIVHLVDALVGLRHFILSKIYYKIMGN